MFVTKNSAYFWVELSGSNSVTLAMPIIAFLVASWLLQLNNDTSTKLTGNGPRSRVKSSFEEGRAMESGTTLARLAARGLCFRGSS